MLRMISASLIGLLFYTSASAGEYQLFVSNESAKPMTIVKETGEKIVVQPNDKITTTFRLGTTITNYVDNKVACQWHLPKDTTNKYTGLIYGWFGNPYGNFECVMTFNY